VPRPDTSTRTSGQASAATWRAHPSRLQPSDEAVRKQASLCRPPVRLRVKADSISSRNGTVAFSAGFPPSSNRLDRQEYRFFRSLDLSARLAQDSALESDLEPRPSSRHPATNAAAINCPPAQDHPRGGGWPRGGLPHPRICVAFDWAVAAINWMLLHGSWKPVGCSIVGFRD